MLVQKTANPGHTEHPPRELYIYYLQGRVEAQELLQNQPDYLGTWVEDELNFLFFCRPALERIQDLLQGRPWLKYMDSFQMSYTEWLGHELQIFQSGRWRIVPAWQQGVLLDPARDILLDPGLVFGSGQHPTTRDCLQALDWILNNQHVQSVLDLGTGSGILALAAALAASARVLALDLNPLAARTARNNIQLNKVQDRVLVLQAKAQDLCSQPADILLANIHLPVLEHILDSGSLSNKKWFILSGLLRSQSAQIKHNLEQNPDVQELRIWNPGQDWITLLGKTQSS